MDSVYTGLKLRGTGVDIFNRGSTEYSPGGLGGDWGFQNIWLHCLYQDLNLADSVTIHLEYLGGGNITSCFLGLRLQDYSNEALFFAAKEMKLVLGVQSIVFDVRELLDLFGSNMKTVHEIYFYLIAFSADSTIVEYDIRLFSAEGSNGEVYYNAKDYATSVPQVTKHSFILEQNYPNPFNPTSKIRFTVPEPGLVNLVVYNLLGQKVAVLVNERKTTGSYEVKFDASGLPSGVYMYKLQTGSFLQTKKMIYLK